MKTKEFLEMKLRALEKKEQFQRATGMRRLSGNYLEKARHNLVTTRALWALSENENVKEEIGLSSDYEGYDWVVVSSYYSMYHAALSALASIGFKSNNHMATIYLLHYYFVLKGKLERKYIDYLEKARILEEKYVEMIKRAKRTREAAQYSVEKSFGRKEARKLISMATDFVNRIDEMLSE
ncbi:HEPN domain-containing protein [Candidatus Pyrohabitans sp.]